VLLWKATRRLKRPTVRVPTIKITRNEWIRCNKQKAELLEHHLSNVFHPNDIQSFIDVIPIYQPEILIKAGSPLEISKKIDNNLNPKKASGIIMIPYIYSMPVSD
ncbi:hypothetical protein HHI36_011625, partial [Cryptolaemus montrouzieri]